MPKAKSWPIKPGITIAFSANMKELLDSEQHPLDQVYLISGKYLDDPAIGQRTVIGNFFTEKCDEIECQFSGFLVNRAKRARNCRVLLGFDAPDRRELMRQIRKLQDPHVYCVHYQHDTKPFRVRLMTDQ